MEYASLCVRPGDRGRNLWLFFIAVLPMAEKTRDYNLTTIVMQCTVLFPLLVLQIYCLKEETCNNETYK